MILSKNGVETKFVPSLVSTGFIPLFMTGLVVAQDNDVEADGERRQWPIEITVAAGLQYDDTVSVEELDRTRSVDDFAAVLDLDLRYRKRFDQGSDLRISYSLAQKSYFEETDFDLQIHNLSFNFKQDFEHFDLGLQNYNVLARLDDSEILNFQHISPYLTTFLTDKLYLRTSYFYRNKDFPDNPERDGQVHAADTDLYYFINGTRNYIVAGLRYENENTRAAEFEFNGRQLELRYARRVDWYGDRPVRIRLDWRIEDRDYKNITPSLGARRDDQRQRWRARVDFPISTTWTALFSYQYRDHESNLAAADFDDNRVELQFEAVF